MLEHAAELSSAADPEALEDLEAILATPGPQSALQQQDGSTALKQRLQLARPDDWQHTTRSAPAETSAHQQPSSSWLTPHWSARWASLTEAAQQPRTLAAAAAGGALGVALAGPLGLGIGAYVQLCICTAG